MAPLPSLAQDPKWADVTPIVQDEPNNALATIAYAPGYAEASAYLRACMAADELSARALELTAAVIALNPAHYTVWLYRAKILQALGSDLVEELEWLNEVSLRHIKNYQIWHHRQTLVERLGAVPVNERDFLAQMLEADSKNYHVWSYRQWLVKRFALWNDATEKAEVERLLRRDVRNNSAWNHRWFLTFGHEQPVESSVILAEVDFVAAAIAQAPANESSWTYLKALHRKEAFDIESVAQKYAAPGQVKSAFALEVLADAAEARGQTAEAAAYYRQLEETYDVLRRPYWAWRRTEAQGRLIETSHSGQGLPPTITAK